MKSRTLLLSLGIQTVCLINAAAVNISNIPPICILEKTPGGVIELPVAEAGPYNLVIPVSSNPELIPSTSLIWSPLAPQKVNFSVVAGQTGTAEVELSLFTFSGMSSARVTIVVAPPLSIPCPADLELLVEPGFCEAVGEYELPEAEGGCAAALVNCVPPPGAMFAPGTTIVSCTAESTEGTANCSFNVTVANSEAAPTLACPQDILAPLPAGASSVVVTFPSVIASACGIVSHQCTPPSGSAFSPGVSEVQCIATTASGETATCTFKVTVEETNSPRLCPLEKGYWKKATNFPVEQLEIGGASHSTDELARLLRMPVKGDASVILGSQLVAALLNIARGSDPAVIQSAIDESQAALSHCEGELRCRVAPSSELGRQMTALAGVLEEYNSGALTPSCE